MRSYSRLLKSKLSGFLICGALISVSGCSAPTTPIFDAADVANAGQPATCPDFSGRWLISTDSQPCQPTSWGEPAMMLPRPAGFAAPQLPAEVVIRQDSCRQIVFRIVRDSTETYSSVGKETTFDLFSSKAEVSWSENRLAVRYQPKRAGPILLPGVARTWAMWSLERVAEDQLDYQYAFVEKGAMFFVLPFKDDERSSCRWRRLDDLGAAWR